MRLVVQIAFGLLLGLNGLVVLLYLGFLVRGQPDLWTGAWSVGVLAMTQGIAIFAFRRHIAIQIVFGLGLCAAVVFGLIYSPIAFFWETPNPDGSFSETWRSCLVLLLLLIATQWISSLVFLRTLANRRRNDATLN
jgi:hypothetical protein